VAPALVPPNPLPTPILRNLLANQPTTGLLGGSYRNSLLNALADPQLKLPNTTPSNTNVLIDLLSKYKDPFEK
jgi:hypothetical protein